MLFNVDSRICTAIYPGVIVLDRGAGGRAGGRALQVVLRPLVAPAASERGVPFRAGFVPTRPNRRRGSGLPVRFSDHLFKSSGVLCVFFGFGACGWEEGTIGVITFSIIIFIYIKGFEVLKEKRQS